MSSGIPVKTRKLYQVRHHANNLILVVAALLGVLKWFWWLQSDKGYYARYPGAKLIDDAARQGKLDRGTVNEIVNRVGKASDMRAEVKAIRSEREIQSK